MADTRQSLVFGRSVVLDATGSGQITIGPDQGKANWEVTSVITQTDRPGTAPVPRVQLFLGTEDPQNSVGIGYDGSYGVFVGKQELQRGNHLIARWTGGQAGDRATVTVNGEQW